MHGGGSDSYRGGWGGGGREICFNFPIRKGKYGEKKIWRGKCTKQLGEGI